MSRDRYKIYRQNYPHFITLTYTDWLPLNSRTEITEILLNVIKYHQTEQGLTLYGWVFMENHIHLILKSPNLSKTIHSIKSYSAKQILAYLKDKKSYSTLNSLYWGKAFHKTSQEFQVWEDGFHPVEIGSKETMMEKLGYVHNNTIKRGYVRRAEDWRYSSMGSYLGYEGELLYVCIDW